MQSSIAKAFLSASAVALMIGHSDAAVLFDESFDYPDGPLTAVSSGAWYKSDIGSGVEQLTVNSGQATMTFSNSEDVSRDFGQSFTSGTLYYSAVFTMTVIPGTSGAYFMHLSDTDGGTDTDFFARVFVKAVGDGYQLGIRNRSLQASPSDYPVVYDESVTLSLDQQVALVVKFDFSTLQSTLWINPLDESSASVTDTFGVSFAGSDQSLSRFSLREASGIGTSLIDQIIVGTTFNDVFAAVPEPGTVGLMVIGGILAIGAIVRRK